MTEFVIEPWDDGRLLVNAEFRLVLQRAGLLTFDAIASMPLADVVRRVKARTTARFTVRDGDETRAFYIKKHDGYPIREVVKPLLKLSRPVLGARAEWEAILRFHRLGIPTMVPVAFGQSGRRSFLVTEALEPCERADLWLERHLDDDRPAARQGRRELAEAVARITRTMHEAHLHHQDLYLCHFLLPVGRPVSEVCLIDLGRVRAHRRLPRRWRAKDLAQLHYSACGLTCGERVRFLRDYFGRRLRRGDRGLLRTVELRRWLIARHTARNGL